MAEGDTTDAQGTGATTDTSGDQGSTDEQRNAAAQGAGGAGTDEQNSGTSTTSDNDDDDPRVKRANREAAGYRRQLREEQAAREALEARIAELEKPNTGADDTAEQLRQERERSQAATERVRTVSLKAEVATIGPDLKLADVETALALLDSSSLEWKDDQPTPESVKDALEELLERKPFLKATEEAKPAGAAKSGTGATAGAAGSGGKAPAETDDQRRSRLRGGGGASVWDPATAARLGGGVVQP